MSLETLDSCLELIKYANVPLLNLSGGEITEIDNWVGMIEHIIDFIKVNHLRTQLCILSNGTFLLRGLGDQMTEILNSPIVRQLFLSTNSRWYRHHEEVKRALQHWSHPKLHIFEYDRTEVLKNLGRARNLNVNLNTPTSCSCAHIFAQKPYKNLKEMLNAIPPGQCAPMINVDGKIYLGWGTECKSIGLVSDPVDVLFENMKNFEPCGYCKQVMPYRHIRPYNL